MNIHLILKIVEIVVGIIYGGITGIVCFTTGSVNVKVTNCANPTSGYGGAGFISFVVTVMVISTVVVLLCHTLNLFKVGEKEFWKLLLIAWCAAGAFLYLVAWALTAYYASVFKGWYDLYQTAIDQAEKSGFDPGNKPYYGIGPAIQYIVGTLVGIALMAAYLADGFFYAKGKLFMAKTAARAAT